MSDQLVVQLIKSKQGYNCLGLKTEEEQKKWHILPSRRTPWITEATNKRLEIKRAAYLVIHKSYQQMDEYSASAELLHAVLSSLSAGAEYPDTKDLKALAHTDENVTEGVRLLTEELDDEDKLEFAEFVKTLTDARPYGMVGKGHGRNEHLAELITLFTYIYEEKPQNNPLLYGFPNMTAQSFLTQGVNIKKAGGRREAVKRYMEKISIEIQRIMDLSPQDLGMTFSDDDVKHVAIVRKMKLAFNRLSADLDYGYRYNNPLDALEEKTNNYKLVEWCPKNADEHLKLQSKLSIRSKKYGIFWISLVSSFLIAVGQVAIAVFAATGVLAIGIGISAGLTSIILFTRDIKSVLIAFVKGDLTKGQSRFSKFLLGLWFVISFATGIVSGGLVMVSLVSLFGFVMANAPVLLLIGAGIIAVLTIIGMTSLYFQVGAGIAKGLRGKSLPVLLKGAWESFKSFIIMPDLKKETQDLKTQAEAYRAKLDRIKLEAGGSKVWKSHLRAVEIQELRKEYYPIRGHLRREMFAHRARHGAKLFFTLFFVPVALVAAVVATYAFSVISATGTADTIKTVLGWSDKLSMTVSNILTWGFSAIVNGALSAQNLVVVAVTFSAKVSKLCVGLMYGVATFFNLAYHGRLLQAISHGIQAFRENPLKTIIPSVRTGLAVAMGVVIVLNGYGNGATAGEGAFPIDVLPSWFRVDPSTVTVILATASSMALNKAAIDDITITDTPIMTLENPGVKKRKPDFDGFFGHKKQTRLNDGSATLMRGDSIFANSHFTDSP